MSNQGWNFPAPPPPPPVAAPQVPPPRPQGYPPTNGYGHRGRGNPGQYRGRGRGRGDNSRGGHFNNPNANQYPPPIHDPHFPPVAQSGYANQHQSSPTSDYQSQGYGAQYPAQLPQYPPPNQYYQPPVNYQQSSSQTHPPQPAYDPSYSQNRDPYQSHRSNYAMQPPQPPPIPQYPNPSAQAPQAPPYIAPPTTQSSQNRSNSPYQGPVQPQLMGPPIRWSFDSHVSKNRPRSDARPSGGYHQDHRRDGRPPQHHRDSRPNHHSSNSSRNGPSYPANQRDDHRGQKRRHGDAFDKRENHNPPSQISPSVPSFGISLPSKPPPPANAPIDEKPAKKPRHRNKKLKLGLTPKGEDHESSEEDDADEETKLASKLDASGQSYEFSYRGATSTLSNPSEIAAWIEERKKRYPTLAKVAETKDREKQRQTALVEAKKARDDALKIKRQEREDAKIKREEEELEKQRNKTERDEAEEAALKAKVRAEKLRRKLLKEQNRLANAEAEAERTRVKAEELKSASASSAKIKVEQNQDTVKPEPSAGTEAPNPFADFSSKPLESSPINHPLKSSADESSASKPYLSPPEDSQPQSPSALSPASSSSLSISDSSSDPGSLPEETTSPSASEDSAPEEASSRPRGDNPRGANAGANRPGKSKKGKKGPCSFFQNGNCKNGRNCRYSHNVPREGRQTVETGGRTKEMGQRKGLYQIMVDKELAEGDAHVLEAITYLGDQGVLDEPEPDPIAEGKGLPAVVNVPDPDQTMHGMEVGSALGERETQAGAMSTPVAEDEAKQIVEAGEA